ncbi:MAG TPA: glycosyltransferase family 4 protein [Spirillospora sp.]|nr:glycosyltransferase family 4 protein [Spirillospora sp.]
MRIGIVTGEYPPMRGGVGAYTSILAHQIAADGHEVHLLSVQGTCSDDIPLTNHLTRWGMGSLKQAGEWAQARKLDILNLQFQTAAFGMSPWIHFLPDYVRSIPVVTTFHDLRVPYLFPKAGFLRDWIVMHLARASAGVIVTNQEDAARIQHLPRHRLIPIGSNIREALPPGYNPAVWRERAGAAPDSFLIAYFGLMNRSKGLETLLSSISALRDTGVPVRLLIIGGEAGSSDLTNTRYMADIDRLIEQHNLSDHIHRTGFLDNEIEVGSFLKESDVVALPFLDGASFRRGSLMAAIHYGCPIVTTMPRVPIPEFAHNHNMLLIPAHDTDSLTRALDQLYRAPELRHQLGRGAEQLAAHFDWQHITASYLDFLAETAG